MPSSDSTNYTNYVTNKYAPPGTVIGGHIYVVNIEHTILTAEAVNDTVRLGVHRAYSAFVGGWVGSDGAVTNTSVSIGDGTTATKYFLAATLATTGLSLAVNAASIGYTPTADKPITLTWGATGDPGAGTFIRGYMLFVQA